MIRNAIIFAVCTSLAAFAGCATAPRKPPERVPGDYGYTREFVSWLIAKEMRKQDVPGLSIALVDDQRVVWAQGFGSADVAKGIPAGAETVYQVGSVAKLFTVTCALQLAEQGRLDIDRSVRTYLPRFSLKSRFGGQEPITVRQLMTHHTGLPRDILKGMWNPRPEPLVLCHPPKAVAFLKPMPVCRAVRSCDRDQRNPYFLICMLIAIEPGLGCW